MQRKIMSFTVALSLIFSCSTVVLANPLDNQVQQNKSSLNKATNERQSIESNIELLDDQIHGVTTDMKKTKDKIDSTQKYIKVTKSDINKTEQDMQKEQEVFNERMRAMYMNGNTGTMGYLSIMLDSKGISDFLSRADTVNKIAELDKKIISDLNTKKDELQEKKVILENESKKLQALKVDQEEKLSKLNTTKSEQKALIAQAKAQEDQYRAQIEVATRQVNEIRESVPKYVPSRGSALASSNSIVAYASNFLGSPYVWGATGPNTFDCSGFTQYVYAHFGIGIPRTSQEQACVGSYVSRSELQPGDLVCFGHGDIGHIGIYVGNGTYIHAPHTGDVVKYSDLDSRSGDFAGGRRIR